MPKNLTKDEFFEKYRDPRWQKKRLEVMERDDFCCCLCYKSDVTLNVHHSYYKNGLSPWEYPYESLYTLCDDCHLYIKNMKKRLIDEINNLELQDIPTIIGTIIAYKLDRTNIEKVNVDDFGIWEGFSEFFGIKDDKLFEFCRDKNNYQITIKDIVKFK